MKDRLRKLRRFLDITQQEFADRIGISRNNIAGYETGKSEPGNAVIALICREFNVNEIWLRTGEGEMFEEVDPDQQLLEWAGEVLINEPDTFQRRFLKMLSGFTAEDWALMEKHLRELFKEE